MQGHCYQRGPVSDESTEPGNSSREQDDVPKRKSDDEPAEKRPIRRAAAEARRKLNKLLNT